MSLVTPTKIRMLQRKLYVKAKKERRRHKVQTRGTRQFSNDVIHGDRGVRRLRTLHVGPPSKTNM